MTQANIDVNWDELEDQDFLNDMASHSAEFSAEKLVPKGLKGVKGAKVSALDDDDVGKDAASILGGFNPKSTFAAKGMAGSFASKKPPAKKKAVAEPSVDGEDGEEEIIEFGLAGTPNKKPAAKKTAAAAPHKRPRTTKSIETSEIPEGKITLPSAGDALMEAATAASEED